MTAFSLAFQPSASSAAPQNDPAARQNQPAHRSARNVKQNNTAPTAAGRESRSSRAEKSYSSAGDRKGPGTGMEKKDSHRAPRTDSAR